MVANISAVFIWQVCICSAESAKSHTGMIALQPLDAAYIARLAGVITSHIVSCSIIVFQLSCGIFYDLILLPRPSANVLQGVIPKQCKV